MKKNSTNYKYYAFVLRFSKFRKVIKVRRATSLENAWNEVHPEGSFFRKTERTWKIMPGDDGTFCRSVSFLGNVPEDVMIFMPFRLWNLITK